MEKFMGDIIIDDGDDTENGSNSKGNRPEDVSKNSHVGIRDRGTVIDLSEISQSIAAGQKALNSVKTSLESLAIPSAIREMQKIADQYKNLWASSDLRASWLTAQDQFDSIKTQLDSVARRPFLQDIQKITDQYRSFWDSSNLRHSIVEMQKAYKSAQLVVESPAIAKIIDDVRTISESYNKFLNSPAYPKIYDTIQDITNAMNASAHLQTVDFSHINITNVIKEYDSIREIPIVVNRDGTISSQSMTFTIDDIRSVVDDVIQKHVDLKAASIEGLINSLILKISELKEPLLKRIFIGVIIGLISTLIFSFVKPLIDESIKHFSINRRIVVKEIQKEARTQLAIDSALLKNLRIVVAKCLNMRANKNRRSSVVALLYFGSIVRVIERRKNWTLVEYVNPESQLATQGWVFSRYLKKVR